MENKYVKKLVMAFLSFIYLFQFLTGVLILVFTWRHTNFFYTLVSNPGVILASLLIFIIPSGVILTTLVKYRKVGYLLSAFDAILWLTLNLYFTIFNARHWYTFLQLDGISALQVGASFIGLYTQHRSLE